MFYYKIYLMNVDGLFFWVRREQSADDPNKMLSSDAAVIKDQLVKGIPESALSIPEHSVVLDVGAHLGSYCIPFAKKRPDCMIYAMEPEPFNYGLLVRNVIANSIPNVTCLELALGSEHGLYPAVHRNTNTGSWTMNPKIDKFDFDYQEEFYTITPSELFHRIPRIDYVKLDIEGSELSVLEAMEGAHIVEQFYGMEIEVHNDEDLPRVGRILAQNNFRFRSYNKDVRCLEVYR